MSEELKRSIDIVLEADKRAIEDNLGAYKEILVDTLKKGELSIPLWIEGVESRDAHNNERTYSLLECASLIKVEK